MSSFRIQLMLNFLPIKYTLITVSRSKEFPKQCLHLRLSTSNIFLVTINFYSLPCLVQMKEYLKWEATARASIQILDSLHVLTFLTLTIYESLRYSKNRKKLNSFRRLGTPALYAAVKISLRHVWAQNEVIFWVKFSHNSTRVWRFKRSEVK